jgi:hypothetical protein
MKYFILLFICVCVCVCARARACVCVCVCCAGDQIQDHEHAGWLLVYSCCVTQAVFELSPPAPVSQMQGSLTCATAVGSGMRQFT